MNRSARLLVIGIATLALGACEWFKSPSKDNIDPPTELEEFTPSVGLARIWGADVGEGGARTGLRLQPLFHDGRLYAVGADGKVSAYDAESGRQVWRADLGARLGSGAGAGAGIVVVGGLDGGVFALDAASGDLRWSARASSEVLAAPAIGSDIAVVRANDGRVFGFGLADGERRWVFDRAMPLLSLRGNGSPLIQGESVYLGYDNGKIVALRLADGVLQWEQTLAQSEGRSELERMVDVDGELASDGQELFAVSYRGQVGALAADTGRTLWSREMSAYGGVAMSGDRLYVTDAASTVWSLDARSGTALWKNEALAFRWLSSPAVVGDYVAVADFEGYVHLINSDNGQFAARTRVGSDPVRAAPLVVGSTLYVAGSDGDLAAFRVGG